MIEKPRNPSIHFSARGTQLYGCLWDNVFVGQKREASMIFHSAYSRPQFRQVYPSRTNRTPHGQWPPLFPDWTAGSIFEFESGPPTATAFNGQIFRRIRTVSWIRAASHGRKCAAQAAPRCGRFYLDLPPVCIGHRWWRLIRRAHCHTGSCCSAQRTFHQRHLQQGRHHLSSLEFRSLVRFNDRSDNTGDGRFIADDRCRPNLPPD